VPFGGGSYEIRLAGRLGDSVLAALECEAWGLTVSVEPAEMMLYGPVQDQDALGSLLDRILSQASTPVTVVSLPGRRAGLEMEGRDESHRHLVASCWPLPCEEEASLLSEGCERIDLHRCLHRLPCWWRVPG
jgi:hypothetical protein